MTKEKSDQEKKQSSNPYEKDLAALDQNGRNILHRANIE